MDDGGCAILKYAYDTLIVYRVKLSDIIKLRSLLDAFIAATGLHINYTKSTAMLIHMDPATVELCMNALGCRHEGFP